MSRDIVTLDVREDIAQGREPFAKFMSTVARLCPEDTLRLIAPFEPLPLFSVLAEEGYTHAARQLESGDWDVSFARNAGQAAGRSAEHDGASTKELNASSAGGDMPEVSAAFVEIDARGLEAPQPMVKILEALETLPPPALRFWLAPIAARCISSPTSKSAVSWATPWNKAMAASLLASEGVKQTPAGVAASRQPKASAASIRLPLQFILVGLLALFTGTGWLVTRPDTLAGSRYTPTAVAAIHLFVLG